MYRVLLACEMLQGVERLSHPDNRADAHKDAIHRSLQADIRIIWLKRIIASLHISLEFL